MGMALGIMLGLVVVQVAALVEATGALVPERRPQQICRRAIEGCVAGLPHFAKPRCNQRLSEATSRYTREADGVILRVADVG